MKQEYEKGSSHLEYLLKTPLQPETKVRTVLISGKYPEILRTLNNEYNIETFKVIPNLDLDPAIASHADCLFIQLKHSTIIIDKTNYNRLVNYLTSKTVNSIKNYTFIELDSTVKSPYPDDVKLNAKIIGDKIICNTSTIAHEVIDYAKKHGYLTIHTNQGYTACSSVIINNNALITDDESIYISSVNNGIDTLLINKGSVKLDGYDYGFIGGTCGMIDKNLLAFTGKLNSHTDYKRIEAFLNKYNVNFVELTNGPLIDIGGIIPILE